MGVRVIPSGASNVRVPLRGLAARSITYSESPGRPSAPLLYMAALISPPKLTGSSWTTILTPLRVYPAWWSPVVNELASAKSWPDLSPTGSPVPFDS